MQTFEHLQSQIGAWSLQQFQHFESPYFRVCKTETIIANEAAKLTDTPLAAVAQIFNVCVDLNEVGSLLGLVAELAGLTAARTPVEYEQAIGSSLCFLCDYCCRVKIAIPTRVVLDVGDQFTPEEGLAVYVGHLCCAHFKKHTRIMGFHEDATFADAEINALAGIIWHLEAFAEKHTNTNLLTILNQTWNSLTNNQKETNDE